MKKTRIFIVGGYGNFGQYIARALGMKPNIQLIIGGRSLAKAQAARTLIPALEPIEAVACDVFHDFAKTLSTIGADVVIHTSGPFQMQEYQVARACIDQGVHYIDLADSRAFVTGISALNEQALAKKVVVCSGASSVPGLSSAIIEHYLPEFKQLITVDYAIATAQQTNQGLATTTGVLSYAGKPFTSLRNGQPKTVYGWQDIRLVPFWQLNRRFLSNCDIPDLDLFPSRYPTLKNIRFQAGLELKWMHGFLFLFSWLVRLKLLPPLNVLAKPLLHISRWFNWMGTDNSGFYMTLEGIAQDNTPLQIRFEMNALHGDGLYIPCVPALFLAEQIALNHPIPLGAYPCVGLITLTHYLELLQRLGLDIFVRPI